jgi:hypothetical protein
MSVPLALIGDLLCFGDTRKSYDQVWFLRLLIQTSREWVEIRGSWFKASPGKKIQDPISTSGWSRWHVLVISGIVGSTNRKITVQAGLGIK